MKYRQKANKKSITPEQSLWSKSWRLLGCRGNWWLKLAPPRSPDFSFVTDFLFRNILHLHANPIFFLKCFFDFRQTEILGSLQKMTLIPRLHSDEHPLDESRHGACKGLYSWDLLPEGRDGLPSAVCGLICSYPSPISQRQSRSSQAACGGK